jgi:dihydroorotate dehydrogenase (NAD+) catalytic subunit
MTDQTVAVGSLTLKNPVLTASGCFGYGLEYDDFYDVAMLGGICTKGLSLHPRLGNKPARIAETPGGMLNAIGLANVGVEAFCTEKLPKLRERGVTVVANIFASTVEDFVAITERLGREEGVTAIELNVSCPNVKEGGIEFGKDPRMSARVTEAVRRATALPLWVKMSPEAGDIGAVGKACEEAGADALTAINTVRGISIDADQQRVRIANATGGLSGPALRPIALRIVWELKARVNIPIIGIGGVFTARDAVEFMLAGATAVQVGTANFVDPSAAKKVVEGIARYTAERGIAARDLIGRARP